jgi:hypothetical protein|tara:strand:+ start:3066 stop:3242 length:177 start_codon:yes stop_codon:yes gene_type:complete
MKYLTGKDYDWLCEDCQKVIDRAYLLIVDGFASDEYADDNEGPSMFAYDNRMFGSCCE